MNSRELIQAMVALCRTDTDADSKTVMVSVTDKDGSISLVKLSHDLDASDPGHAEKAIVSLAAYYYQRHIDPDVDSKELCLKVKAQPGEPDIAESLAPDDDPAKPKTTH